MALSGYQGVDIAVKIQMDGIIHDTYTVALEAPAFTTISPGGLTFTPTNYNVDQTVIVNCNAIGNCKIKTRITAPYNPTGSLDSAFDVDILPFPLSVWVGTTPKFDETSLGDLQISYNNVVIGHKLNTGASLVSGLAYDVPFLTSPSYKVKIVLPDGSSLIQTLGPYTTTQLGVHHIIPITTFCQLQQAESSGHTLAITDFTFGVVDAGGGTVLPTVTAASIKSQGFACISTAVHFNGLTGPSISVSPIPSSYTEQNILGVLTFDIGGVGTGPNATGSATGGSFISVTGTATAGFWGLNWSGSVGGIVIIDGFTVGMIGGYLQFSVSS